LARIEVQSDQLVIELADGKGIRSKRARSRNALKVPWRKTPLKRRREILVPDSARALDAADSIRAQDSLEKMLVHEMAVLHHGMMKASVRMNEELNAAAVLDEGKPEAANVRACRLAAAISRMSATYQQALLTLQRKRTGGNQHVTVKHIHQQVNVTEGGQAVVAGDKVTGRTRERRGSDRGEMAENEQ
jgi:hypothetical protein